MDQQTIDRASAEADRTAPVPSITDLMPKGAATVGGRPATPVNAATMRFLQAISRAMQEDIESDDCVMFALYCRVHGATHQGRAALWRQARDPLGMWAAYQDWAFATSADELSDMMVEHMPEWAEVAAAQQIVEGGADGGTEGNATGSQSS